MSMQLATRAVNSGMQGKVSTEPNGVTAVIPSELSEIQYVLQQVKDFVCGRGADPSGVSIVLRELLKNAIIHGNRKSPTRHVMCSVMVAGTNLLRLTVEDQGEGFNHTALDMALPEDPTRLNNRGYRLINAFCEHLDFNEKGNRIVATMRTRPEPSLNLNSNESI